MSFKKTFLKTFRKAIPFIARHWNRYEIRGLENIASDGSKLLAINHSGGWDYDNFLIMSALDHIKTENTARKKIWLFAMDTWCDSTDGFEGLWSNLYRPFYTIPIDVEKKKKEPIPWNKVDKIVDKGELMCICPEGHGAALYEGYRLWKFYPGVIKIHLKYKIPIIPCAHIGPIIASPMFSNKYDPNERYPWVSEMPSPIPFILPYKIFLHIGKPIYFQDYYDKEISKEKMFELASIVRGKVAEIISLYRKNVTDDNVMGFKNKQMYKKGY
jgi:1-acyl-sn-glycerol-3-phosphate acyltransferase